MSEDVSNGGRGQAPLAGLRRFVRPRPAAEECDLCSVALGPVHQHLLDPSNRQLLCACDPCALLFSQQTGVRYRRVPRRQRRLVDFHLDDAQWDELLIPVGMAFFFHNSAEGQAQAFYPSPAGAVESLLPLESWAALVAANPILAALEPDVEALLVNRLKGAREYYLVPIDRCYELVGLIRAYWRGLSGGPEVWREIGQFFSRLQATAQPHPAGPRPAPAAGPEAAPPDAHA